LRLTYFKEEKVKTGKYLLLLIVIVSGLACKRVKEEWIVRCGASESIQNYGNAIVVDDSGNVYVTGSSVNQDSNPDYLTIKYSPQGEEQWTARYNGTGDNRDEVRALAVDALGNVYVTGSSRNRDSDSDYATIKYNPRGEEEWVARYDAAENSWDGAEAIAVDAEGNVYVTGWSVSQDPYGCYFINYDYLTIKYSPQGEEKWVARYDAAGNSSDKATAIAVDAGGNVYVTGWSINQYPNYDYLTIKYSPQGEEKWVARYNGTGDNRDEAKAIAVDAGGNVYVTGDSNNQDFMYDYVTIKYSPQGEEKWVARYNGPGNGLDQVWALAVDAGGNAYVTGSSVNQESNPDYATVKYGPQGEEQWVARYNGPENDMDIPGALILDAGGNVYVTGLSMNRDSTCCYATIKYSQRRGLGVKARRGRP
jgi:uncharacterized delta-60 repeat protein